MECDRRMIYFSVYENGVKTRRAGYAGIFLRGNNCDVQIYYRENGGEEEVQGKIQPIYIFRDGTVVTGAEIPLEENMAAAMIHTGRKDFMQSGRCLEELDAIYLDGVSAGMCGGRLDGQELVLEVAYTLLEEKEAEEKALEENQEQETRTEPCKEIWTPAQFMERLPEMKLPFDGVRRKCCRMGLTDLEHLSEKWQGLKDNHFLLHGFYEYHHLLLVWREICGGGSRRIQL